MRSYLLILVALLSMTFVIKPVLGQDGNELILTIAVRSSQQDLFQTVVHSFEEVNLGIKVILVPLADDHAYFPKLSGSTDDEIKQYFDNLRTVADTADLIPVLGLNYDVHVTRTGALLDLAPLLNADPNANIDDIYPAFLNSFAWDGGIWALPISGNVEGVLFNPKAFDAASLAYPSGIWTMRDYLEAAETLTQRDSSGNITVPGFYGFDTRYLFRALLGHPLIDNTNFLLAPELVDPELVPLLDSWNSYSKEIGSVESINYDDIPLTIGELSSLEYYSQYDFAPLANNSFGVRVEGYAISAGTAHPEMAYKLLQFLSNSLNLPDEYPARRSVAKSNSVALPQNNAQISFETAIDMAFSNSDMAFYDYLFNVVDQLHTGSESSKDSLLEAQQNAINNLAAIETQSRSVPNFAVATPVPTPILQNNEIALNFEFPPYGINKDLWLAAINDFVNHDTEVANVKVVADQQTIRATQLIENNDCFYIDSNLVSNVDTSQLVPLESMLLADPTFDEKDVVKGVMAQVTRDSSIWGLPFSIRPYVIWYNASLFQQFNIPEPSDEWNISDFELTLQQAYEYSSGPVFRTNTYESSYLLMLMEAYGGHLIDYSQVPYKFNLIQPSSIEAAKHVLDWVKAGMLGYQATKAGVSNINEETLMFDSILLQPQYMGFSGKFTESYRHVPFPQGKDVRPISYDLSAFYISSRTPYPQACYRLISFLSRRTELLDDMPVRRSQFAASAAAILYGDEIVNLFQTYDEILSDPHVVVFPSGSGDIDIRDYYIHRMNRVWLSRAFDGYVFDDSDLEVQMEMAQKHIDEFNLCVSSIGPAPKFSAPDTSETAQERDAYFKQFDDCAVAVDPSMSEFLFSN